MNEHDRVIAAAAKNALTPMGLTRKGRSRTWLDDQGWWLGIVEFQPSSWSLGTYLNVGLMFLWRPIDFFAFEIGGRVETLSDSADAGFAAAVEAKAARAAREITDLRARFRTLADVVRHYQARGRLLMPDGAHLATALGLLGDLPGCRVAFDRVLADRETAPDNQREATQFMVEAREAAVDVPTFRAWVQDATTETRRALRLAESGVALPQD